jgi:RNA polymerase sigma factor (sigma-70 family)
MRNVFQQLRLELMDNDPSIGVHIRRGSHIKYIRRMYSMNYYGKGVDTVPPMIEIPLTEEMELWRIRKRSPRARNLLTRKYLCLAFKLAGKFKGPRLEFDEAIGAANAGLMEAMSRYNHLNKTGTNFACYSVMFIRRHLINALVATYPVKVGDRLRKKYAANEGNEEERLKNERLGEAQTIQEVFARLSRSPEFDITSMFEKPMDAPGVPFEAESPADCVENSSLPEELQEGIDKVLSPLEQKVIKARYFKLPALSFDDLGKKLGKTKIALREAHDEALVKLRRYMKEQE